MTGTGIRSGKKSWGRLVLIILVMAACAGLWTRLQSPPDLESFSTSELLETAGMGPVPEASLCSADWIHLEPGGTPAEALLSAGVAPGQAHAALAAFETVMPVRAIQPRDAITLISSRDGNLVRMELQRFPQRKIVVDSTETGFAAHRELLPTEKRVRRLQGEVASTLYEAMHRAGGDDAVLVGFAELFAWDFDFATDTRRGDTFTLLLEETWADGCRLEGGTVLFGRYTPVQDKPLQAYFYRSADRDLAGYYDAEGRSLKKRFLKSPLNFTRISSRFTTSRMHPILKKPRAHLGVDYAAPTGTPVVALGSGKVVFAGWIRGFGKTIKIQHGDGYLTQYGHLSRIRVRNHARVDQNQVIGNVGMTGMATGPHLDFRVQEHGRWINPLGLKGGSAPPLPDSQREAFAARVGVLDGILEGLRAGESIAWVDGDEAGEASRSAE